MVGVGMGVDDCGQLPALCIQNFLDFSAGILIVSAVDQPDIVITYAINADFGRGIDVIGIFCDLHQFIHGQNLLYPLLKNKTLGTLVQAGFAPLPFGQPPHLFGGANPNTSAGYLRPPFAKTAFLRGIIEISHTKRSFVSV